jgi:hypothetical protein
MRYTDNKERTRMQVSAREEVLVEHFRLLPPDVAEELSALVQRLAALAPETRIDWSDSWSDDDLREFTDASIQQFEARENGDGREGSH